MHRSLRPLKRKHFPLTKTDAPATFRLCPPALAPHPVLRRYPAIEQLAFPIQGYPLTTIKYEVCMEKFTVQSFSNNPDKQTDYVQQLYDSWLNFNPTRLCSTQLLDPIVQLYDGPYYGTWAKHSSTFLGFAFEAAPLKTFLYVMRLFKCNNTIRS